METSDSTTKATATTATSSKKEKEKENEDASSTTVVADGENKMDVESKTEEKKVIAGGGAKTERAETATANEKKKTDEPDFQMIANPARVLPQQVSLFVGIDWLGSYRGRSLNLLWINEKCVLFNNSEYY